MAKVTGRFKKGKINIAVVEGKFNGQGTTAFTLKKRVLKDGKWQDSAFLTITDLQDILSLTTRVCSDYVKFEEVKQKPDSP